MGNLKLSEVKKINEVIDRINLDQIINEILHQNGLENYKLEKFKISPIGEEPYINALTCPPGKMKVRVIKPSGVIDWVCI